jgi:hypothetical protein
MVILHLHFEAKEKTFTVQLFTPHGIAPGVGVTGATGDVQNWMTGICFLFDALFLLLLPGLTRVYSSSLV